MASVLPLIEQLQEMMDLIVSVKKVLLDKIPAIMVGPKGILVLLRSLYEKENKNGEEVKTLLETIQKEILEKYGKPGAVEKWIDEHGINGDDK